MISRIQGRSQGKAQVENIYESIEFNSFQQNIGHAGSLLGNLFI